VTDDEIQSTWATRELPILRAALRRLDAGADFAEFNQIEEETGFSQWKSSLLSERSSLLTRPMCWTPSSTSAVGTLGCFPKEPGGSSALGLRPTT